MKKHLSLLLAALLLLSLAGCSGGAQGTGYPKKTITMIVPYGAGGTADVTGRQLAAALEKQLGRSIVVENMPGASGSVGARAVLDAAPDGYTIFLTADSLGTQRVMGISDMSYADFAPIAPIGNDPKLMVVARSSPYADVRALLDDLAARPGKVQMSYTGPGGSGHVQALILRRFGYEAALTPYNSGAECIAALLGGQVAFTNANYSTAAPYIESGDLRALAVCATEPLAALPDVPVLSDVIPESDALLSIPYTPTSLLVDKDVPDEVRDILRRATLEAVRDADFDQFMTDNCIDKLYEKYPTTEDTLAFYADWESTLSWMLYDAGATVNSPAAFGIPQP